MCTIKMYRLLMQNEIDSNKLDEYIQYCIGSAACEVAEGLARYPPGDRAMEKIDEPQNDMS
jgi:hypothetical protein